MIIAREGFVYILALMFITIMAWLLDRVFIGAILFFLTTFVTCFFRNPERTIPEGDGLVVSPADGRIIDISPKAMGPLTREVRVKVSIFMSVFNVHINRLPISGRIVHDAYFRGGYRVAKRSDASDYNERNALVIEDDQGRTLEVVQVAGLIARRIIAYFKKGMSGERGERMGLIQFGSRVDLYLPVDVELDVHVGDRMRAGESIVGRLP